MVRLAKHFLILMGGLLVILTLVADTGADEGKKTASREILIVFSGNALGELKPCGCAKEEDQGGIERRMAYLKSVRKSTANTLLIDLGDNFKEPTRQGRLKAGFLLTSLRLMNYDAITLGEKDLVYGNEFIKTSVGIPWVASNVQLEGMDLPTHRVTKLPNGMKILMISLADPGLFYASEDSNLKLTPPAQALQATLPSLLEKETPDLVVLLSHMRRVDGLKMLDIPRVDIVINGHIESDTDVIDMTPLSKGEKAFAQPGPLGQKMGELWVSVDSSGKKTYKQRMIRLDSKIPDDPGMTQLYEKYNEKVEEMFIATLEARRSNKATVFATETTCKTCHPQAHDTWAGSRHGRAYETLKRVNKSFDPECLVCHTTGFNKPGGFISEIDTPKLKNVQCEMCHGPQLEHSQSPKGGFAKKARAACQQCHVKKHSPNFNFDKYWPKIQH